MTARGRYARQRSMSKRRKRKRKRKPNPHNLLVGRAGPHHETSPMGHATRTKSRKERQAQLDRKRKANGWRD